MIVALKRRLRVVTAWPRTSARPSWRHPLRRHAASGAAPLHQLDPHVEDVRPLSEAADAIAAVEIGHARGKVVIEVS